MQTCLCFQTGLEAQMDCAGLPAVRGLRWSRSQNRYCTPGSDQDHFPRQDRHSTKRFLSKCRICKQTTGRSGLNSALSIKLHRKCNTCFYVCARVFTDSCHCLQLIANPLSRCLACMSELFNPDVLSVSCCCSTVSSKRFSAKVSSPLCIPH